MKLVGKKMPCQLGVKEIKIRFGTFLILNYYLCMF